MLGLGLELIYYIRTAIINGRDKLTGEGYARTRIGINLGLLSSMGGIN